MKGTMKQIRQWNGLTQNETAKKLGISKSTYIRYERMEDLPNISTCYKFAEVMNVNVDEVIFFKKQVSYMKQKT